MTEKPASTTDPERRLLDALGHTFRDRTLLLEALTHRSYVNEVSGPEGMPLRDNERLEFLGDAVLDLVVSTELMRRFRDAREGELSRMRAAIVHEGALARLARTVELGAALRLGRGEEMSGGRDRPSLLADAFEAVVAAVYLDAGWARTLEVVVPLLSFESSERLADWDPKTELQHRIQGERRATPTYRMVSVLGPVHEQVFVAEVVVGGEVLGRGEGRSKKHAEQAAASAVLSQMSAGCVSEDDSERRPP